MKSLSIALLAGALASLAGVAGAETIEIGLQEAGVNGGALTTVATGTATAGVIGLGYGGFVVNNISAQGFISPGSLYSNSINTTSTAASTLTVEISLQGIVYPTGTGYFTTGFTSNQIPTGWTVVETSYLSPNDALYGETTFLDSHTFTSIGTVVLDPLVYTGPGPFSITEVYTITATAGGGSTNNTIDVIDPPGVVPEPGSLALLGVGLVSLAVIRRLASRSAA